MKKTKGIILAGGKATRLWPMTTVVSKQLLPVYDKPMIYYPLSTLMLGGIEDILVISTPSDLPRFKELLGNGSDFGINISYAPQEKPRGLPDAFMIGKDFIGQNNCLMILGDNIIYGQGVSKSLQECISRESGSTIFGYPVKDPRRYGVIEIDHNQRILSLEEKPVNPKSNIAVIGLYHFDNRVAEFAETLKPSERGELEILDLSRLYHNIGELRVDILRRGFAWFDAGTPDSLSEAGEYIRVIQNRQGYMISCPEEIAFRRGFINKDQLTSLGEKMKNTDYGKYLLSCCDEN